MKLNKQTNNKKKTFPQNLREKYSKSKMGKAIPFHFSLDFFVHHLLERQVTMVESEVPFYAINPQCYLYPSAITSTPEETVQQMATCTYHFGIMGKVSGWLIISLCSYIS